MAHSKPLTQTNIEALKPRQKPYKVFDGGGLHLLVTPSGGKLWRLAYRHASGKGLSKTLALGAYDREKNGLTHARAAREAAKLALKAGRDPARTSPDLTGQATFEAAARAWHERKKSGWVPKYAEVILTRLEQDVFPVIGAMQVGAIRHGDVLAALRKVEARGAMETAYRLAEYVSAVFKALDDESVPDPTPRARDKLKPRPRVANHKKLRATEIGSFMLALDTAPCDQATRWATLLTVLTAARTSEIIGARVEEFEQLKYTGCGLWRLPEERMKAKREHLVPLSTQAVSVVKAAIEQAGNSPFLFPSSQGRTGHISNNTMLFNAYAMGFRNKTTMHGFRGAFSTYAHESDRRWDSDWIEMALAHGDRTVRGTYNAAEYLSQRRELLQWWGDSVDSMRNAARQDARIFA